MTFTASLLKRTAPRRIKALTVTQLLKQLVDGPKTYEELREATGMGEHELRAWVRELRLGGLVHIADWEPDRLGRLKIAVLAWQPGAPDARRKTMSRAEIKRRYRERVQARQLQQALTLHPGAHA